MRASKLLLLLCLLPFLCGAAPQAGQIRRIYNLTLTSANTEYSQTLTGRVSKFTVHARGSADMKLAFTSGESGTTYFTVKSGDTYWEDLIVAADVTMYLQSTTASTVAEIVAWSDN